MASFGQDLKHERETRGVSLKEISDSTRISLRYLEALEADRLDLMPQKFFVRAIIGSYARAVGLDVGAVLEKFDDMVEFGEQLEYKTSGAEPAPARPGVPRWTRALLLGLFVAAAGALLYVFVLSPRKTGPPPAETRPAAAVTADVALPEPVTPAPEPPSQEPAVPRVTGLNLEAAFSDETWLRVIADGRQVYEGTKAQGETLEVKAERDLILSIGNAGGMDFSLNGRRARPLGPRGAVMTDIRVTLDNLTTFLAPWPGD